MNKFRSSWNLVDFAMIRKRRILLVIAFSIVSISFPTATYLANNVASASFGSGGGILLVSTDSAGAQGTGGGGMNGNNSAHGSPSYDGRYVAFQSNAHLAGNDIGADDIYIKDTVTGATTLVSATASGQGGDSYSYDPTISQDGRYVVFWSWASNLVPGDTNSASDLFLKDTQTGSIQRVDTDSSGSQANNSCNSTGYLFGNDRYVAFNSFASNLVANDTNDTTDVFVKDTQTGSTFRISTDSAGHQVNGLSSIYDITFDGTYAVIESDAANLVPGDTNGQPDMFVKNLQTGAVIRVSTDSAGNQVSNINGQRSNAGAISEDGRYVTFASGSSLLVPGDTNNAWDVFVKDTQTGAVTRVNTDASGNQEIGGSATYGNFYPSISSDGAMVAFHSGAANLVYGDTNNSYDIFVKELASGSIFRASVSPSSNQDTQQSYSPMFSGNGEFVAFHSWASNLVAGDNNNSADVFLSCSNPTCAHTGRPPGPDMSINYYFPWYDSVTGRTWILTSQPSSGSLAAHENTYEFSLRNMTSGTMDLFMPGSMLVNRGETRNLPPNGRMGGPVQVKALDGEGLVSERSLFGNSFEEVWGATYDDLDSHYWWPVYDSAGTGMKNWVLAANPPKSIDSITVRVTVHNANPTITETRDLAPGESWTPIFPGRFGGPVEVKAWASGMEEDLFPRKVITSQRLLFNGAFNEMPGTAASRLDNGYIWTWYDNEAASNWIVVANPGPEQIRAIVSVGNVANPVFVDWAVLGPYQTHAFHKPGIGGPVFAFGYKNDGSQTHADIVASQRVLWGPSIGEIAGTSFVHDLNYTTANWTWYDQVSAGVTNWVLIANPTNRQLYAEVRIGGVTRWGGTVDPFANQTPTFPGNMGGPVEVESWLSETNPVTGAQIKQQPFLAFASQRVLWNGYFNEVVGKGM